MPTFFSSAGAATALLFFSFGLPPDYRGGQPHNSTSTHTTPPAHTQLHGPLTAELNTNHLDTTAHEEFSLSPPPSLLHPLSLPPPPSPSSPPLPPFTPPPSLQPSLPPSFALSTHQNGRHLLHDALFSCWFGLLLFNLPKLHIAFADPRQHLGHGVSCMEHSSHLSQSQNCQVVT